MILSVRVDNFLVYSNDVELSLKADMRIKKFNCNVYSENRFNVLKSACVYGANNAGKTCIVRAINSIRNILLGMVAEVPVNIFTGNNVCSFGISFLHNGRAYSYDFKFDLTLKNALKKGFIYEKFSELSLDKHNNLSEKELFIRDVYNDVYRFSGNEELSKVLGLVSSDNILIYTINTIKYPIVERYKQILREFASKIEVLSMDDIPLEKTIKVLKENEKIKEKTIELIKLADLDIDDYLYLKDENKKSQPNNTPLPQELVLRTAVSITDMFRLTSVHRGKPVPSFSFDSTGTKKIIAIASYIIEALTNGKILVVDELDSSLHFKLTRAIVALFNNDLNKNAQLIFTAHDVTLLDCKKLFRKDQICFAAKDYDGVYLYSLADYTAQNDGIRSESDILEKYSAGVLGAVPEPDLISLLLKGEDA
ncbi:MAG: ATP-binding protein [Clostridia bacterium]|nr:ATP-binding protein [Clostridia bacterium]